MDSPFEEVSLTEDKRNVSVNELAKQLCCKEEENKQQTQEKLNSSKEEWIDTSIPARLDRLPWGGVLRLFIYSNA